MNNEVAIFLTTFVKEYQDDLISFLIEKGYQVGAYSASGRPTQPNDDNDLFVVAVKITKLNNLETRSMLHSAICNMLVEKRHSYFSLLIQELDSTNNITWGAGKLFRYSGEDKNMSTGSPYRDIPNDKPL